MADDLWSRVYEHTVIEPEAHVRIGDVELQARLYDHFHTHPFARWSHVLGTPAVLFGVLAVLATVPLGPVDLALPVLAGLCLWYARVDPVAAVICAVTGLAAWLGLALWAPPLWLTVGIGVVGLCVQTFSHLCEPVPPPWAPGGKPCSLGTFLSQPDKARVLLGVVVMTTMGFVLEAWAVLRIPPYQVLFVLRRLGWQRRVRGVASNIH